MSYNFLIKGKYKIYLLKRLTAAFLGIAPQKIKQLFDVNSPRDVSIQLSYCDGDFPVSFAVYKKKDFVPHLTEVDFAIFLANQLNVDVVIPYWGLDPYTWIVVKPSGRLLRVDENLEEDLDGIRLKDEYIEELDIDTVRQNQLR